MLQDIELDLDLVARGTADPDGSLPDWERLCACRERQSPEWVPGSQLGYAASSVHTVARLCVWALEVEHQLKFHDAERKFDIIKLIE